MASSNIVLPPSLHLEFPTLYHRSANINRQIVISSAEISSEPALKHNPMIVVRYRLIYTLKGPTTGLRADKHTGFY